MTYYDIVITRYYFYSYHYRVMGKKGGYREVMVTNTIAFHGDFDLPHATIQEMKTQGTDDVLILHWQEITKAQYVRYQEYSQYIHEKSKQKPVKGKRHLVMAVDNERGTDK